MLLTVGASAATRGAAADGSDGASPLMTAVKSGNHDMVRMLLGKPVDVNAQEVDGTTALHWSVRGNDLETTRLLLGAGARADQANRYGVTPLSLAALNGNGR
jgi:ankyrin repeat protein